MATARRRHLPLQTPAISNKLFRSFNFKRPLPSTDRDKERSLITYAGNCFVVTLVQGRIYLKITLLVVTRCGRTASKVVVIIGVECRSAVVRRRGVVVGGRNNWKQ